MQDTFLIDALFTIFMPRGGMDRYQMMAELVLKLIGRTVTPAELKPVYDEKRKEWEHKLPPNHGKKWAVIDREILHALFPDLSFEEAERFGEMLSVEILSNPGLYEVNDDTRKFLERARAHGFAVIIASNQDRERLQALITHFGITPYFNAVYTSTEIGFEKPDPRFFRALMATEGLDPRRCALIGNNPENDIAGAQAAGIPRTILYDPARKYEDFIGERVARLSDILNPDLFFWTE